ncbi:MAG TPA: hypothetical protein VNW50_03970 [Streptosporangiaceae bacterium]|jgi:NAD(P)-dependent dehydrogenase (short-subunit alcohol dehydrogenase family)|nr:hypothetical protein [Streptosporangiaceae bacterium]
MNTHVAIVAGAGGGLGHATAEALAGSGFTVVARFDASVRRARITIIR